MVPEVRQQFALHQLVRVLGWLPFPASSKATGAKSEAERRWETTDQLLYMLGMLGRGGKEAQEEVCVARVWDRG